MLLILPSVRKRGPGSWGLPPEPFCQAVAWAALGRPGQLLDGRLFTVGRLDRDLDLDGDQQVASAPAGGHP